MPQRRIPFAGSEDYQEYIRAIVRDSVIYGWASYTQQGQESQGRNWQIVCLAIDRINSYRIVEDGVFSYEQLGVQTYGETLPFSIVQEHMVIRNIFSEAKADKAKLGM